MRAPSIGARLAVLGLTNPNGDTMLAWSPGMYKKILVPIDFSNCSRAALSHAMTLAEQLGASVDALYVAEVPAFRAEPRVVSEGGSATLREYALEAAQGELDAFMNQLEPSQRKKVSARLDVGRPRDAVLEHAKRDRYDLIVMGTHGRTGRAHSFAGSLTESVVRTAPCPVLTVRAPD
jgi:nucleotide-binding universal stress UspA family protein